jgi:NTE family protein
MKERAEVKELMAYGCPTRMHVVRLLAPPFDSEDHTKDVDFSLSGIKRRWDAGYEKTVRTLSRSPWTLEQGMEGVFLHELDEACELA